MMYVCDAIMGSGKSQAAIHYMNTHPEHKFIYITPYLDETLRIQHSCPTLHFRTPSKKNPQCGFSKIRHTRNLLENGENIATTHAAFMAYTDDMIDNIKKHNYTLIIDEAVDAVQECDYDVADVKLLEEAGYIIRNDDGTYSRTDKIYEGTALSELYGLFNCGDIFCITDNNNITSVYWRMSARIIKSFDEVFVLTYQFEGQVFKYYMDINQIKYQYIGIHRAGQEYSFSPTIEYIPEYVTRLSEMIHIDYAGRINNIGDEDYSLSHSWYKKQDNQSDEKGGVPKVKKNLHSFIYDHAHASSDQVMWSVYKDKINAVKGRGYANREVPFNSRATNVYKERTVLAYCVNIFMTPSLKQHIKHYTGQFNEDTYALSIMLQWIWRSAIRDGKEISIYIPSKRMRSLLENWIEETQKAAIERSVRVA